MGAPERTGTITNAPQRGSGENRRVQVAFDSGSPSVCRVENLEPLPDHRDIFADFRAGAVEGAPSLRRNLLHEKLHGRLSNVLYSMETSNTRFLPYQFKPVLKLLDSPTNSLLIADEVGLGKTIEAGLIWTELKARVGARNLLVVCPPHLREKWETELRRRFGVKVRIGKAADLLDELREARNTPGHSFALIVSYHSLRPPVGWEEESPNEKNARVQLAHEFHRVGNTAEAPIDLLVMDEAHYMRNPGTRTSKLGDLLAPVAAHRVFLSATPLHTRARNLYSLLSLLDPDTYTDEGTFEAILEANEPLVRLRDEVLRRNAKPEQLLGYVDRAMSNPLLSDSATLAAIRSRITGSAETLKEPRTRSELAYQVERSNLLGLTLSRTRKRDVFEDRVIRHVEAVKVKLSPDEMRFYRSVTDLVLKYSKEKGIPTGFLAVMPQRQAASCMAAARQRWTEAPDDEEPIFSADLGLQGDFQPAGPLIQHLKENMAGLPSAAQLEREDGKYRMLRETLRGYWNKYPGRKAVLFAYFKPTLRYLKRRLQEDGILSLLLTGGGEIDKQSIVKQFEEPTSPLLLLSSEVGSEGLDLQFASALVNYDLPWNPMVVEQRIGRLDRIGQEAKSILIFNLVAEGTVDERIYDRLYQRLDLFKRTLGDLEDVLGPLITELSIDLLTHELNEEEIEKRLEATETAIALNLKLEEQLEEEAGVLAAYGDYVIKQIAASHELERWVSGSDLETYIVDFFRNEFPAARLRGLDPQQRTYEIELDPEAVFEFDQFLSNQRLHGQTGLNNRARRRIRFDHRTFTATNLNEEVIHQAHPLVRFAGTFLRENLKVEAVPVAIRLSRDQAPAAVGPGIHAFVVQRWSVSGFRETERLHYHVVDCITKRSPDEETAAEQLVERAAAVGTSWPGLRGELAEQLKGLSELLERMDEDAGARFTAFEMRCANENGDRARIQLNALRRFEQRRGATLQKIVERLTRASKPQVEAFRGQIRELQNRCELQRRRIQQQARTTGEYKTLSAGLIYVV